MADFSKTSLVKMSASPAAPEGLQQQADRFAQSAGRLQQWAPQESMLETAQSWYRGATANGVDENGNPRNGWDTPFYQEMFRQRDEWLNRSAQSGNPGEFFNWLDPTKNATATGVSTWNDENRKITAENGVQRGIKAGDVFENGKWKENLYTTYDKETADTLLGEFLFTNDEKERAFAKGQPHYARQIEERVAENSNQAANAESAWSFQKESQQREKDLRDDGGWLGFIGLGAGGGAAVGAGIGGLLGSVVPFFGTAAGAAAGAWIGTAVGGLGAAANQDQLIEMTAKAIETTDRANQTYDGLRVGAEAVKAFGGVGMKFISPTSNLVQGIYDVKEGGWKGIGDMTSEFYETDPATGERKPGWGWKGLDLAATVVDGLLQFSSAPGRMLYMGAMTATAGGGTASLMIGGLQGDAAGFNMRTGKFDEYEGWQEWSAAIGATAIDGVQLGIAGALGSAASKSRSFVEGGVDEAGTVRKVMDKVLPGGKERPPTTTLNGIRFGRDAEGNITKVRGITLEALAPSEFLRWVPTGYRARQIARARGQGPAGMTADDVYQAALELTRTGSAFRDALLNGYAEGGEEFIQAILEPASFSERATFAEVFEATAYGAAGGVGMGAGGLNRRATPAQVEEHLTRLGYMLSTQSNPSQKEWDEIYKGMDSNTRQRMRILSPEQAKERDGYLKVLEEQSKMDGSFYSTAGIEALNAMRLKEWEARQKQVSEEGDGSLVLLGMWGDHVLSTTGRMEKLKNPANSAVMSAWEWISQMRNIHEGHKAQAAKVAEELATRTEELTTATDPDRQRELADDISRFTRWNEDLKAQVSVSNGVLAIFENQYQKFLDAVEVKDANGNVIHAAGTAGAQEYQLDVINDLLVKAHSGDWRDSQNNNAQYDPETRERVRRSVELKLSRNPLIDTGSFGIFLPQVSKELTRENAHNTVYVHQATLKALGGDHDGDTVVPKHQVYLDQEDLTALRNGVNYVKETLVDPKDRSKGTVYKVVSEPPDGEAAYIRRFAEGYANQGSKDQLAVIAGVHEVQDKFRGWYSSQYGGPLDEQELEKLLITFANEVYAGNGDARMNLLNGMWNLNHDGLMRMGSSPALNQHGRSAVGGQSQVLRQMGEINLIWERTQRTLATMQLEAQTHPDPADPQRLAKERAFQEERARLRAQDEGTVMSMQGQTDPTRQSQAIHYVPLYRSTTDLVGKDRTGWTPEEQARLIREYADLSGQYASARDELNSKNIIEERVDLWLRNMATQFIRANPDTTMTPEDLTVLLANVKVPPFTVEESGEVTYQDGEITMLQLLLRRSLDIARMENREAPEDSDIKRKIMKLERMTRPQGKHSYSATTALLEIYGNKQMSQLMPLDDTLSIGAQMTPNQLKQMLMGMDEDSRRVEAERLRRSPSYMKHKLGDPPWSAEDIEAGRINRYTMVVEAAITAAQTHLKVMEDADADSHTDVMRGFSGLHRMLDTWRVTLKDSLPQGAATDDPTLLRLMLRNDPSLANMIGTKLIPEAAALGVFQRTPDGEVLQAKWLENVLLDRDLERAAKTYHIHVQFAAFNQLGGTRDLGNLKDVTGPDGKLTISHEELVGKVDPRRIRSRFQMTLYHLAQLNDGGLELSRFVSAAVNAKNLAELYTQINNEPTWRGNREKLLPYHDDVALYELSPDALWQQGLPSQLQRENLRTWGDRLTMMGQIAVEEQAVLTKNSGLMSKIEAYAKVVATRDAKEIAKHVGSPGQIYYDLLDRAITNRQRIPDTIGQAARDQFIALLQGGPARMHEKGAPDFRVGPMSTLTTNDRGSYSNALLQETAAITVDDFRDVSLNLTRLVQGPARIQLDDGSMLRIDMSDPMQAIQMLMDPRTHGFAKAVLFPTVRDVNDQNVVQHYQDSDSTIDLEKMLLEQNYTHLFNDTSNKLKQAYQFIGSVESYVRQRSLELAPEDREAYFFSIQKLIDDLVIAYQQGRRYSESELKALRDQVVIDVADALKAVNSVAPGARDDLRDRLIASMKLRFLDRNADLVEINTPLIERQMESEAVKLAIQGYLNSEQKVALKKRDKARTRYQAKQTPENKDRLDQAEARYQQVIDAVAAASKGKYKLPDIEDVSVQQVVNSYRFTGVPKEDANRKTLIFDKLNHGRLNRFLTKETAPLAEKVRRVWSQDPVDALFNEDSITDAEWEELAHWAATSRITEMFARPGSQVTAPVLSSSTEGEKISRYHDGAYTYVLDALFDDTVLAGVDFLAGRAMYNEVGTISGVVTALENGMLSEKKLGPWTDRVVTQSLTAHERLLKGAPVKDDIARDGVNPKTMADALGTGWASTRAMPDPLKHHSVSPILGLSSQDMTNWLNGDPRRYVKLQAHFASRADIAITTDPKKGPIPPSELADFFTEVTSEYKPTDDSPDLPYRVLDLTRIQARIKELEDKYGRFQFHIEVEYVDVDKMPAGPQDRDYANNLYFEGVGRDSSISAGAGALSALFFGLDALSKQGQQNPLDFTAKNGRPFFQLKTSPLHVAEGMEASGASIAEVLSAKAVHLWSQSYDSGQLHPSDLTALYKMMKMRHVVVGYDSNGKKHVMWPQQIIELQEQGATVPYSNLKLVPLSASVSASLLGAAGHIGTTRGLGAPVLNVEDMNTFPLLTDKYLSDRGLTRLGEDADRFNSPLAQVRSLPKAVVTDARGSDKASRWRLQYEVWVAQRAEAAVKRSRPSSALDRREGNKANAKRLVNIVAAEQLHPILAQAGVPTAHFDQLGLDATKTIAQNVNNLKDNPTAVLWRYVQGSALNLQTGTFGIVDLQDNFSRLSDIGGGPVFGDVVELDLGSILDSVGRDPEKALVLAQQIVTNLTERGVMIALHSPYGSQALRSDLAQWIGAGSLGYRAAARSTNFWVPITDDTRDYSTNREALNSTKTETLLFEALGVGVASASDLASLGTNENMAMVDWEHDEYFNREVAAVIPSSISITSDGGNIPRYAYGLPDDKQWADIVNKLESLLKTREGLDHVLMLFGADPEKFRQYNENLDPMKTVENGILPIEQALVNLRRAMASGKHPISEGKMLFTGSIVPVVSHDGSILLTRVGFKLPDALQISRQNSTPLGATSVGPSTEGMGLRIAAATNKIDTMHTVPPPFTIKEIDYDEEVGVRIIGEHALSRAGKREWQGAGFKVGVGPMPNTLRFYDKPLSNVNGLRLSMLTGLKGVLSKQANARAVSDFRNLFALTGIDFRDDLIEFFSGTRPTTAQETETQWTIVKELLDEWSNMDHGLTAEEIASGMESESFINDMAAQMNVLGEFFNRSGWKPVTFNRTSQNKNDPQSRLVTLLMLSMAAPGVKPEHVVGTTGLLTVSDRTSKAQIRLMPSLFTDALNDYKYPELKKLVRDRANSQFPTIPDPNDPTKTVPTVWIDDSFRAHVRMTNPETGEDFEDVSTLIMMMPIASNSNAVLLGESARRGESTESTHNARVVAGATGGWVATKTRKKDRNGNIIPDALDELYGQNDVIRFDTEDGSAFWKMLNRVQRDSPNYTPWESRLPMQEVHVLKGAEKVRQYTYEIDKSGWAKPEHSEQLAAKLLAAMNITKNVEGELREVDYLVRQFVGRPGPDKDQTDWTEQITEDLFNQVVMIMLNNVKPGKNGQGYMHPLHGGMVPMEHDSFWQKVFEANKGLPDGKRWAPVAEDKNGKPVLAKGYDEWVNSLVGQVLDSTMSFNGAFRTALDGFWHTYHNTTPRFQGQSLSLQQQKDAKLRDPETNELYLSIDPGVRAMLESPIIFDHMRATWDALAGHDAMIDDLNSALFTEDSPLAEQMEKQVQWLEKKGINDQETTSVRQYAKQGLTYTQANRYTNVVFSGMVNLSIMMRLANPALYASAFIEVPFRNALEVATNLLTGTTAGVPGRLAAAVAESKPGQAMGWTTQFSKDEVDEINKIAKDLGRNKQFLGELYAEMVYTRFVEEGKQGTWSEALEKGAAFVARSTSDPYWGLTATLMARTYLTRAIEHLSITDSMITVQQLAQRLEQDPLYLKKNAPKNALNAHQVGLNAVAQVRGTKNTMLSRMIMGKVDGLVTSPNMGANLAGHLLKIPFMFTRFNAGTLLTLSGFGSLDQMVAMGLGGREKKGLISRFAKTAQLKPGDDPTQYWDTNDVIESLDLSRAFIRGGITHTGLMTAGMMLGSLSTGLGGEDEEERRRRKLASLLNVPHYYDPREAYNDFAWADAIFFDSVPGLSTLFKNETGHSAVVPHWIIRQFTSPLMGMVRFFETGDVREIGYGFLDAVSVIPNSIPRIFEQADITAKLLADAAQDADAEATAEAHAKATSLLINIVAVYERALLENQFVNALITGSDTYDRDPWIETRTADENTGELDRTQGQNLPQQSNALQAYQVEGPNGEPINKVGYLTRTGKEAYKHQYAENNFTAAILMSLFSGQWGGDSSYFRWNMAPKQRDVQGPETPQAEAEALVLATFLQRGGQENLTKEELIQKLKKDANDAGLRWDQTTVEAQASAIYAAQSNEWAMSRVDPEVGELLTAEGGKAVFRGVLSGVTPIGHPALAGISMSQEMRDKIAEDMFDDLVQEGVDLGLGDEAAMYRARRFWYGNGTDPGLREIIYDNRIPDKPVVTYNQLNSLYAIGPDGKPWATPFQRGGFLQAVGIPLPHTMNKPGPGTTLDQRGNVVDLITGANTGVSSVVRIPTESEVVPNDKAVEKAEGKTYSPQKFSRGYGRRFGGGGGYGGSNYGPGFQRMLPLPGGRSVRPDDIPMINVNTPYVRRSQIRRERISSERGRLKQWQ